MQQLLVRSHPPIKKQLQCVIQRAPLPREECAPVVIPGLRRPWGAAMQVMVRMRRRRRSTIGNHVAYASVSPNRLWPQSGFDRTATRAPRTANGLYMSADDDASARKSFVDARAVPAIRHGRGESRPWAYRGPIGHDGAAERRCPCPLLMRRRHWVKQCTLSAIPFSSGPMPPQRSATAASSPAARISCSHPCTVPQSQRAPNVLRGVSTRTERPWWLAPSDWNQTVPS